MGLTKPSGGGGVNAELVFSNCDTNVGSLGIQLPMTIRPPGRVTRTISLATSKGLGANIAPKMLTTRSKLSSLSPSRLDASPSSNRMLVSPISFTRRLPASTRLLAMSTPRTSAPRLAAGTAVVPSPHPRSRTLSRLAIPSVPTSASPLSRMLDAIRVKSPFSHSTLFGFMASPSHVDGPAYDPLSRKQVSQVIVQEQARWVQPAADRLEIMKARIERGHVFGRVEMQLAPMRPRSVLPEDRVDIEEIS